MVVRQPDVTVTTDHFDSGGKPVRVERFEPAGPGPYPALVLLHGADGVGFHGPL